VRSDSEYHCRTVAEARLAQPGEDPTTSSPKKLLGEDKHLRAEAAHLYQALHSAPGNTKFALPGKQMGTNYSGQLFIGLRHEHAEFHDFLLRRSSPLCADE